MSDTRINGAKPFNEAGLNLPDVKKKNQNNKDEIQTGSIFDSSRIEISEPDSSGNYFIHQDNNKYGEKTSIFGKSNTRTDIDRYSDGTILTRTFVLNNDGSETLDIKSISIDGGASASNTPDNNIDGNIPHQPVEIADEAPAASTPGTEENNESQNNRQQNELGIHIGETDIQDVKQILNDKDEVVGEICFSKDQVELITLNQDDGRELSINFDGSGNIADVLIDNEPVSMRMGDIMDIMDDLGIDNSKLLKHSEQVPKNKDSGNICKAN